MTEPERKTGPTETFGFVVTNVAKLCGVVAAMVELLSKDELEPKRLALIAVLLTGVQGIESLVKGVFGK